jgi:hypothetical protein
MNLPLKQLHVCSRTVKFYVDFFLILVKITSFSECVEIFVASFDEEKSLGVRVISCGC